MIRSDDPIQILSTPHQGAKINMASTVYVNCEDSPEYGRQMDSNPKLPGAKRKSESEKSSRGSKISRKWSAEEINDLIDEFEKHPCLWDVFNCDYHDKTRRQQALKEIEDEIGISAEEIKNKIVGLRTQLGREMDARAWFLVLSSSQSSYYFTKVWVLLLTQCWNRLNGLRTTVFVSNICPTSFQLLLNAC